MYLKFLLTRGIEYLDKLGSGEVVARLTTHINIIQDAISLTASSFLTAISTALCAFIIAYVRCWKLALIVTTIVPAMCIPVTWMAMQAGQNSRKSLQHTASAQTQAAESIAAIVTIRSLQIQETMTKLYVNAVSISEHYGIRQVLWRGAIDGWIYLVLFSTYALAFWQGSILLVSEAIDVGIIVNVLFAIVVGALALSRLSKFMAILFTSAGLKKDLLDASPQKDERPNRDYVLLGDVLFQDVTFAYPRLPNTPVLNGISLHIPSGKTTAIIGSSGSGKSTIGSLLERYYDPTSGRILLDGLPITEYNKSVLRSQIAIVPQEPVLFSISIGDNIRMGLNGTAFEQADEEKKRHMISVAAADAGIATFIERLPSSYDTLVGHQGSLLSGGQRQRIAFARAMIRNPRLLILDEATSAQDQETEANIQRSLDKPSERTTVVIAHRLRPLKHMDFIIVIDRGKVIEQGTPDELLERAGPYAALVRSQQTSERRDDEPLASNRPQHRLSDCSELVSYQSNSPQVAEVTRSKIRGPRTTLQYSARVLAINGPEWYLMLLGLLGAVVCGAAYPAQGYIFGKLLVLSGTSTKEITFLASIRFYSLWFFIVALLKGGAQFLTTFTFGLCAERMVQRTRTAALRAILAEPIDWFQDEQHSTARLVFHISENCARMVGLHGSSFAMFLETATNLIGGAVFAMVIAWKYSLPIVPLIPLVLFSGYWRWKVLVVLENGVARWYERSADIACEAVGSIRTVAAFVGEKRVMELYNEAIQDGSRAARSPTVKSSALLGISHGSVHLVSAFAMWYGARLVQQNQPDLFAYFAVFITLTFGAQDAGDVCSRIPDVAHGKSGAAWFFGLDREDELSGKEMSRVTDDPTIQQGMIVLDRVTFGYSSRPNVLVLSGIHMVIHPSQYVALVGRSGSGKSSLLSLLANLDTPSAGSITYKAGSGIASKNAEHVFSTSYLPQKPILFRGTILFNLLLGVQSPESVTQSRLESICRSTCILEFIQSQPAQFETICDNHTFSVGEKQRIVIARTLLRQSNFLIMDEPTAALDAYSAQRVRKALKNAASGRTTIVATHDLSIARQADIVYILEKGCIIESGCPSQLLRSDTHFKRLFEG